MAAQQENPRSICTVAVCMHLNGERKHGQPLACYRLQGLGNAGPENQKTAAKVEEQTKDCPLRHILGGN